MKYYTRLHVKALLWICVFMTLGSGAIWDAGAGEAKAQTGPSERPNILFIYTDDQAAWAMSRAGHPELRTPNMDRIAREGAYLPNAFTVTPVCSPSRASLMTSRYGSELGITDWIHPKREPALGLDPEAVTWPEVLREVGYRTGLIGKWHLGLLDHQHPTRQGFEYFMGFREGSALVENPILEKGGIEQRFEGYTTNILTDEAIAFIRRNQEGPFLLAVHYRAPHAPWLPLPEEDWAPYRELDPQIPNPEYPKLDIARVKEKTREYLGSVASVDRNVGRLLAVLDELDLAENTVVIFTSDHGYNMGHHGMWHKGNGHWILTEPPPGSENVPTGQNPNMYDTSIRVPAALRWPAVIDPGTVVEETVTNLDWFPTLLAMAGVRVPEGLLVRGRSALPLLEGEEVEGWDNDLYGEYSTHHQTWTHMRMYRTPEWKLVLDFLNPERNALYHLKTDPDEMTNRFASDDPEARRALDRLFAEILEHMRETGDPALPLAEEWGEAVP